MQRVVPIKAERNPNGHTEAEIRDALRGVTGARRWSFRYQLLNSSGTIVRDALPNVMAGSVEQSWLADIKRTAKFTVQDQGIINYLSDRVQPFCRLHLPPYGAKDWVEWPQGVFLVDSPTRKARPSSNVTREVDGFDLLKLYADDCPPGRYGVAAGVNVITAVTTLLGSVSKTVTPTTSTLPVAKEWEPGTSKLRIINDLLDMINYASLSFDEEGQAIVKPYQAPGTRTQEWVYADDQYGLVVPEVDQTLDLGSVANQWVLTRSDPDLPEITATYTNTDPGSLTSTVRRGRTITDFRLEEEAVDATVLAAKVLRLAFEASQVYEALEFSTALMPLHGGDDVYRIQYGGLAINAPYSELGWSLTLKAGQPMKHTARRVVQI